MCMCVYVWGGCQWVEIHWDETPRGKGRILAESDGRGDTWSKVEDGQRAKVGDSDKVTKKDSY